MEFAELKQTIENWIKSYDLDPAKQLSEHESGLFYDFKTEEGFDLSYRIINDENGVLTLNLEAWICPMDEKNFPVVARLYTSSHAVKESMYKPRFKNGRVGWMMWVAAGDLPPSARVTEWLEEFYNVALDDARHMIKNGYILTKSAA